MSREPEVSAIFNPRRARAPSVVVSDADARHNGPFANIAQIHHADSGTQHIPPPRPHPPPYPEKCAIFPIRIQFPNYHSHITSLVEARNSDISISLATVEWKFEDDSPQPLLNNSITFESGFLYVRSVFTLCCIYVCLLF